MLKRACVLALSGVLAVACGSERDGASDVQETVDNLVQAGFPRSDIQVFDGRVYVGLDGEVSLQASREMLLSDADSEEQYRTRNLVSSAVTNICVNGAAFANNAKFSTALTNAIANYNAQPIRWHMTRTSGSTTGCSATITAKIAVGVTGGSSGFPSGGLPFNTINIGDGLNSSTFPTSTVTHVITHELGHTIGFRHSDYFNRSISCGGTPQNEGSGSIGAILIPGTPSGATVGGSIMNSCFRAVETGQFTSTDVTALNTIY
jgi:hypothetical protein